MTSLFSKMIMNIPHRRLPRNLRRRISELQAQDIFGAETGREMSTVFVTLHEDDNAWAVFQKRLLDVFADGQTPPITNRFFRQLFLTTRVEYGDAFLERIKAITDPNVRFALLDLARDFPIWGQVPYFSAPAFSVLSLQHSFHFAHIFAHTGLSLKDFSAIVEFGGGYGRMSAALKRMGVASLAVVDLPVTQEIQKLYLSEVQRFSDFKALNLVEKIRFFPDVASLSAPDSEFILGERSLFFASYSLSETPLAVRNKVLQSLDKFSAFYIAYQASFSGIDNVAYFAERIAVLEDQYDISHVQCDIVSGTRYAIGIKRQ